MTIKLNNKSKALFFASLCIILWSMIPLVSKLGQVNLDNHQFLFWSNLISLITFTLINTKKNTFSEYTKINFKSWINALILSFLGTYAYYILLYFAYTHSKGIEVLVLQYSWPVFVIIFSIIILREKLNKYKVFSIILSLCGVLLVLTKGSLKDLHLENISLNLIVISAAVIFGLFSVLSKKIKIPTLPLTSIYFLGATFFSFVSLFFFSEFQLPNTASIPAILLNGILVNGISYIFWMKALKYGHASFVAPFVFITPVLSAILLISFFGEKFHLIYILGMALVILGGLINKQ